MSEPWTSIRAAQEVVHDRYDGVVSMVIVSPDGALHDLYHGVISFRSIFKPLEFPISYERCVRGDLAETLLSMIDMYLLLHPKPDQRGYLDNRAAYLAAHGMAPCPTPTTPA